ncbi:LpqB family beta-propeller domain-containing protein [uncultured Kocuria sp.]|uniref:LpqB family beta-propeller domain-containing protein n=1 Tax=uncultured Kocuria sp. TaxID=259305 RepID=UPI00259762A8|nr:LpqB family beta-propeller domain-containing protein [uncultured Kocuria sp.]MCT1367541.1 LpqB family beta-propeller domain-containing protein [Rothia sp. p3-SID1597]
MTYKGKHTGHAGARARVVRTAAWVGVIGLLVAGCGKIPTSGPVYHYNEPTESATKSSPAYSPSGPSEGASPSDILKGFINAGTGVENDYAVARQYLTTDLASSWKPEDRTLVYQDNVNVDSGKSSEEYTAGLSVTTSIDDRGIATSFRKADSQTVTAKFEQVNGQWRISAIPNGTMLSRSEFEQLFHSFTLYFYDPTFTYAVPDIRWFANRSTVATSIVRVLLRGPAPYLEGSVSSAIPGGTNLVRQSVPISDSSAEVGLTGTGVANADQLTLERIHTQLEQTLKSGHSANSVKLSVDDKSVETGKLADYEEAAIDPQVPNPQVGVLDGDLVTYSDGQSRKVAGLAPATVHPSHPAMDTKRQTYAYTDDDGSHLAIRSTGGEAKDVDLPENISKPSFDPRSWVWGGGQDGSVLALNAQGSNDAPETVTADWLKGQNIRSLQISRDGTRALVVTKEGNGSRVWVSGINRDNDGTPRSLGEPLQVGATRNVTQAAWTSDSQVVVANEQDGSVQVVSLAGDTQDVNGLSDIQNISAGNGKESIYAQTGTDTYQLTGSSWTRVDTKVRDLSYAG